MDNIEPAAPTTSTSRIEVRNIRGPLLFNNVDPLIGISAESAKKGQQVKIWTRLALSSDEALFHRLAEQLDAVIRHMAQKNGTAVNLSRANTVLLIIKPDNTAELWIDAAAVSLDCIAKRSIDAGSLVFDRHIADVIGMRFPCVIIGDKDKVMCLFREGWSFGLVFDFNQENKLDLEWFSTKLGTLYRTLHYRHLYALVNNPATFDPLLAAGWFPFIEIINSEFRDLAQHMEAGFDIAEAEEKIIAAFDADRLNHLFERWCAKSHFAAKNDLFKEAIDAFSARKPASVIKITLTEIEGVLNDAYKKAHGGQGAKLKALLNFARTSAEQRAGGSDTLFFPAAFGQYLANHTFANFDPAVQTGTAASRHAVGHGAAAQESYTMTRALQAILTLDQLAFYT